MSPQAIAHLTFRVFGLYLLSRALEWIPTAVQWVTFVPPWDPSSGYTKTYLLVCTATNIAAPIILAGVGLLFFLKARTWAARMFPTDEPGDAPRLLGLHAFAYSIVGVALAVDGFCDLISACGTLFYNKRSFQLIVTYTLPPLAKLGCGIALFFGSHGLVRLWTRLRYSGLRRQLGLCIRCGYDLTGNTTGTCPECGAPVSA